MRGRVTGGVAKRGRVVGGALQRRVATGRGRRWRLAVGDQIGGRRKKEEKEGEERNKGYAFLRCQRVATRDPPRVAPQLGPGCAARRGQTEHSRRARLPSLLQDLVRAHHLHAAVHRGHHARASPAIGATRPPRARAQRLRDERGADVTFSVTGRESSAQRFLLAAQSPVFDAELLGPMAEKDMRRVVRIEDMELAIFEMLLHFIYTDSLPGSLEGHQGCPPLDLAPCSRCGGRQMEAAATPSPSPTFNAAGERVGRRGAAAGRGKGGWRIGVGSGEGKGAL
ncbi:BTB/POZ and MATH domain-containing protein 2-like [Panicum miliaceum]|uniref:BTB/POZ and MATH domain-containing protein 2-like n=1 Tax=Panicum miliaceum TaxID=4540 RepID=A0A3L6S0H1_PANMI|nr:BTB/POZ and MATH domain-containing protein 2-like [Panicum miliaceum]